MGNTGKYIKYLLLSTTIILLSACSGLFSPRDVEQLNNTQAVGNMFTRYLTSGYRDYANKKTESYPDHPDAIHFARKGLSAASGNAVMPEPLGDWDLLPSQIEELGTARARLIKAFERGAREIAPSYAALAQTSFDCWIEQEEKIEKDEDRKERLSCKTDFLKFIHALESMTKAPPPEKMTKAQKTLRLLAPVSTSPLIEPIKPEDAIYLAFLDFNSSRMTSGNNHIMDSIANNKIRQPVNYHVQISFQSSLLE